jgi:hypothetical protein
MLPFLGSGQPRPRFLTLHKGCSASLGESDHVASGNIDSTEHTIVHIVLAKDGSTAATNSLRARSENL